MSKAMMRRVATVTVRRLSPTPDELAVWNTAPFDAAEALADRVGVPIHIAADALRRARRWHQEDQ